MAEFLEVYGLYLAVALGLAVAVGMIYLIVRSAIWAYRDAELRGKPGWAVALLVVLCKWPISLLLWLVVRPPLSHTGSKHLGHPSA